MREARNDRSNRLIAVGIRLAAAVVAFGSCAPEYVFRDEVRPSYSRTVTVEGLAELVARQEVVLLDVRLIEDYAADPIRIPGAEYRDPEKIASWSRALRTDAPVVVYCVRGRWVSQKVAHYLGAEGVEVYSLAGGIEAWKDGSRSIEPWPSFRGERAAGVRDGQELPATWDGRSGENVAWKTPIPGLAHSSPIVWGGRVFVTSAISSADEVDFKHGLYGAGDASADRTVHRWVIFALSLETGEILWQRTAHEGVPVDKRHIKATYANSTPATDGNVVVAHFGSAGVFGYSVDGDRLWHRDLGRLDAGAYDAPTYEWGSASSPILWQGRVIVQCDTQGEDFLLALDAESGETIWRTERDELPSWSTPAVSAGDRPELVTNAPNYIRGYDPATGRELWRLGGSSKITAPTPIFADGYTVVVSGRRPEKPIFVLRPGARGDITLQPGESSSDFVVWHKLRHGSYMPTPIVYDGVLYVGNNDGILGAYRLADGEELYRERIPHSGGGFSASPVASDDRLFFPSEDGEVFVLETGPELKILARNPMGERLMASPALSGGKLIVRGEKHLFAIARSAG